MPQTQRRAPLVAPSSGVGELCSYTGLTYQFPRRQSLHFRAAFDASRVPPSSPHEKAKLRAGRANFAETVMHLASDESESLFSLPKCAENGVHIEGYEQIMSHFKTRDVAG